MESGSRDFPLRCKNVLFSTIPGKNGQKMSGNSFPCMLSPALLGSGRPGGLGKKYTKSGDAILVIQQPRPGHCSQPGWGGWVGLPPPPPPPGEFGGKKTRRKKLDASDTAGTKQGGSVLPHEVVISLGFGNLASSQSSKV